LKASAQKFTLANARASAEQIEIKKSTGANKGYIACPKAGRLGNYPVSNYLYRVDAEIALNRRGTQRTPNRYPT
jgi:hypothetical protein